MLSVEEALAQILADVTALAAESVPLAEVQGRVLAEDLHAPFALPPFSNSSMDGYAVRAEDLALASAEHPVALRVVGVVPAGGVFAGVVMPGTTVRMFTGAPLPDGADAVLQQELTMVGPDDESVAMLASVVAGTNVREAGSDIAAGTVVVERGTLLGTPEIGALAAIGVGQVAVTRRPRVAIVTTGDELVAPGQPLAPGQIYDSNAPMLAAAVREAGGEPWLLPPAPDTLEDLRARFTQAQTADLVLASGGVSVGDFDLVRAVLAEQGQIAFWRVNVRPGKPLAFGRLGATPFLGLPGNPVSSAVTFELFTRPLIRAMLGCRVIQRPTITVRLAHAIARGDRRHYARAHLRFADGLVWAATTGDQGSHRITSLLGAVALLIIPEGEGDIPADAVVQALLVS
jgi:molybdopterin molybdotransferase